MLDGGEDYSKIILPTFEELQQLIVEDSKLPEHIRPTEAMKPVELSQVESILLTGATGVLGPYLLRELSNRPNIKKIVCLIRRNGKASPEERLLNRLKDIKLDGQIDMSKVECIQGDITNDLFGLSDQDYNRLAINTDVVINSAVRADHTAKYYQAPEASKIDLRTVNVKGTARILDFAVHSKLKHVYQGSSLLSVTTTEPYGDGEVLDEDGCYDLDDERECVSEKWEEVDAFDKLPYNLGYPISKHVSEQLCKEAVKRGVPCKTFRFPVIGGDVHTGRCDYRTNHVILRWLTYLKLRCMPDMPMPMSVIAVDDCARMSLAVFLNPQTPSDVYNVCHPGGSVDQIMIRIAEEYGIPIKPISTHGFINKLKVEGDDTPLAPFMKLYRDDEEELFEILEQNTHAKGIMKSAEDSKTFFRSRKLAQLVDNYDCLESTEVVMRRDIRFLKESGVFDKFGIK
jgi:thioester reductase-like protein